MLKSELIKENENLKKQNGELYYLLEFGKLVCENRSEILWYKDSNAFLLQRENKELKETINKIKHILNNQINYREFVDMINDIEDILKEV